MHVLHVPAQVALDVGAVLLPRWKDVMTVTSYVEVARHAEDLDSYLYVELSPSLRILIRSEEIPSQLMRKAVAQALQLTEWDWRTMRNWTDFRKTVRRFIA